MLTTKISTKEKVYQVLYQAYQDQNDGRTGYIFYAGQRIRHYSGWIPQSVICNPTITGSTEGKRRLRELRQSLKVYTIEHKHDGKMWLYRLAPREIK